MIYLVTETGRDKVFLFPTKEKLTAIKYVVSQYNREVFGTMKDLLCDGTNGCTTIIAHKSKGVARQLRVLRRRYCVDTETTIHAKTVYAPDEEGAAYEFITVCNGGHSK